MEQKNKIELVQIPVISHKLQEAGKQVTERLSELNINNLVATTDTIKSMKGLRASLNKEAKDFESQRKLVKDKINAPFVEFEAIYKEQIISKYKDADNKLKDKIGDFENKIKEDKKKSIESFFQELCLQNQIDFVTFDRIGLNINLSTSEKSYREDCEVFINKIKEDLSLISTQEHEAEILAEYKETLNVSASITSINDRKEREKAEKERLKQQENLRRKNKIISLKMRFDTMTNVFAFNDEIYISEEMLYSLSKDEFQAKYIELESKIKNAVETKEPETKQKEIAFEPKKEPLKAPEKKEEIVRAVFEVKGTYSQLKSIGEFMKQNNINYKNI